MGLVNSSNQVVGGLVSDRASMICFIDKAAKKTLNKGNVIDHFLNQEKIFFIK